MQYDVQDYIQWPQVFKNDSGETIPPFAAMIQKSPGVTTTDLNGDVAILCDKPGATFTPTVFVNGRYAVTAGKLGRCCPIGTCPVAHDPDWTPAFGEAGGIKPDSWLIWKGYPACVRVLGVAIAEDDVLWGNLLPVKAATGKAASPIAALSGSSPGSGTIVLWGFDGTSMFETTIEAVVKNLSQVEASADVFLQAKEINGAMFIDFESCGGGE